MEKQDVRNTQEMLLSSELYREVVNTECELRSRSEYDIGTPQERQMALLCYALQESAMQAQGTAINLAGVYRTLHNLKCGCAQ